MKTEFKAKFLQHLNQRRQDKGFTLIELLVVIIIIGILSAIALPSFLNQANKAKQSEAKQYLSSINKGQQAYYAENTQFAGDITSLGIGLKTATNNFTYAVTGTTNGAQATAQPATGLRPYTGGVLLVGAGGASTTTSALCEGNETNTPLAAFDVAAANTNAACPQNFSFVTK